jgi:hypothetical protein
MNFLDWLKFFGWDSGTVADVNDELARRAKLFPHLVHELDILIETLENPPKEPGNLKLILERAKVWLLTARSPK